MSSVWSKKTNPEKFDTLNGEITVDAAVIGGGLAGILTELLSGPMKYATIRNKRDRQDNPAQKGLILIAEL